MTARDVLQDLDRVLALQAAEDYAIGYIERSDHQRGIEDSVRDGQRTRYLMRLTSRFGFRAEAVNSPHLSSALLPESQ